MRVANLAAPGCWSTSVSMSAAADSRDRRRGRRRADRTGRNTVRVAPAQAGTIALDGRDVTKASVAARTRSGMAYMPADRSSTALVRSMSIAENMMLRDSAPALRPKRLPGAPFVGVEGPRTDERLPNSCARSRDDRCAVVGRQSAKDRGGARTRAQASGAHAPHQAASGLDPGATRFVLERVIALRDAGAAVLYLSSELEEVLGNQRSRRCHGRRRIRRCGAARRN